MATKKQYRKLITNPLGLGTVTISKEIFSDDDVVDNISKKKLQLALKAKMCEEYVAPEVQETTSKEDGDKVAELNAVIETKDKEIYDLKLQLVDGYAEMDADSLAKEFTIPELEFICNHEKIEFKSGTKEATLAKKIVEARG